MQTEMIAHALCALPAGARAGNEPPGGCAELMEALLQARAFDFLHGRWHVRNRRLARRLQGCRDWVEFDAASETSPLPGGIGNQEVFRTSHWPGFVGMALRMFDPKSQLWNIYWADNFHEPGVLQPPVSGTFANGVGIFEGRNHCEGRPVLARFTWVALGPDAASWEQAFSEDGGATWEPNWIMELTRR